VSSLDAEDAKIVTLARAARGRVGAAEGAAVRDTDGRTYVGTTVALPSLTLSALQVAVAAAVTSGATGLEAAALVTEAEGADAPGRAAVTDLSPDAPIIVAGPDGTPR
jgi:cytidine deaminase